MVILAGSTRVSTLLPNSTWPVLSSINNQAAPSMLGGKGAGAGAATGLGTGAGAGTPGTCAFETSEHSSNDSIQDPRIAKEFNIPTSTEKNAIRQNTATYSRTTRAPESPSAAKRFSNACRSRPATRCTRTR
ncbi:MAG: hypothetical protein BWZ07_03049 [Alphaproteobacteria bacterium ADurb.BinA280]|nr:MAG: hypothetical protein BWZ07_03049 [Alphaproteobacteria bacterium ADurb.BinA280]